MSNDASRKLVEQALEDLGREIGIEVADGTLIVPFDDFQECFLRPDRDGEGVVLECALAMVYPANQDDILRKALLLNVDPSRVGDGVLFFDRAEAVLMLRAKRRLGPDGAKGLGDAVSVFIDAARDILEALSASGEAGPSAPTGDALHVPMIRI
jgi:hypothetical protein